MRVGIDCTVAARPVTGFETYVACLASALGQLESDAEFVLFAPRPLPPVLGSLQGRATFVTSPFGTQVMAHQLWLASAVHRHRVDVMHYPAFPPVLPPRRFVLTVHDATAWKFRHTMSAKARVYFQSTFGLWMRRSALIITPSEATKDEIARRFGVPDRRLRVIPHGIRNSLRSLSANGRPSPPPALAPGAPYVLFVGTVEPRKNLVLAIRALGRLKARGQPCRLVIAGRLAWGTPQLEHMLAEERVRDAVVLMGHVSDQELASLYRHAACLVQPSVHEGFGYPVAEAMALGCPVLATRIPSHVEVLGDAGLYTSPDDVDGFADGLSRILNDEGFRMALAAKAMRRSESFTWRQSAERTLEAYRDAINS